MTIIFLVSGVSSLKCISIKNQECEVRELIINNEHMFYPHSIKVNRCNGNCNNISDPYSKVYVPDVGKNISVKMLNLILWKIQTKKIKWHESCKCECRLDPIICNNKQKWDKDKCRCECKKLVHEKCDENVMWNPSSCHCEYKKKQLIY